MKLDARQEQKQTQALSQYQAQSLSVLAMDNSALEEFVRNEQEENPLLEVPEQAWSAGGFGGGEARDEYWNAPAPQELTLQEHLLSQLDERTLAPEDLRAIRFLLDSLDASGYLTVSAEEAAALTRLPAARVQRNIERLRALEPAGVAADTLAQCLELQLTRAGETDGALLRLVREHLEDVGAGRYAELARVLGVSRARLEGYLTRIRALNPRPGAGFGESGVQFIVPDLVCRLQDGAWDVRINDGWMGAVGLSGYYEKLLRASDEPEVQAYFTQKLARARFVLMSIEKRRATLTQIAEHAVERQSRYLLGQGPPAPYTFRQLAAELGVHESTVGRGVRDKYIDTPRGTMPLRALFTVALGSDEAVSRDSAVATLCALVAAEDPARPLSDQALSARLASQGIRVSRRTVAKYRELAGIPSTSQRRQR